MENDEKSSKINELRGNSPPAPLGGGGEIIHVRAREGRLVREAPRAQPAEAAFDALYSPRSQETLRESLNRALSCLGIDVGKEPQAWRAYPWHQLECTDVDFIAGQLSRRFKLATVKVTLSCLRGVFRHAWKLGYIDYNSFKLLCSTKTPGGRSLQAGRRLTSEELGKLRAWSEGLQGPRGALVRACFALMVGAGLRAEEVCMAPVEAFAVEDGMGAVRVVGKGRKEREVAVGASETALVSAWLEVRRGLKVKRPWLFVRVGERAREKVGDPLNSQWLGRLCREAAKGAGVKSFTPHDCRRTFATTLLEAAVDLAAVQRLMGHESPVTTALYDRRQTDADARALRGVKLW